MSYGRFCLGVFADLSGSFSRFNPKCGALLHRLRCLDLCGLPDVRVSAEHLRAHVAHYIEHCRLRDTGFGHLRTDHLTHVMNSALDADGVSHRTPGPLERPHRLCGIDRLRAAAKMEPYQSGRIAPNFDKYQLAYVDMTASSVGPIGITRPRPASVFALPTVMCFFSKSICFQVSSRISSLRFPVMKPSRTKGPISERSCVGPSGYGRGRYIRRYPGPFG